MEFIFNGSNYPVVLASKRTYSCRTVQCSAMIHLIDVTNAMFTDSNFLMSLLALRIPILVRLIIDTFPTFYYAYYG